MSTTSHQTQPMTTSEEDFTDLVVLIAQCLITGSTIPLPDGSSLQWFEVSQTVYRQYGQGIHPPQRGLYIIPSSIEPKPPELQDVIRRGVPAAGTPMVYIGTSLAIRPTLAAALSATPGVDTSTQLKQSSLWKHLLWSLCRDHEAGIQRRHQTKLDTAEDQNMAIAA